jgi:hypothetical protein
MSGVKWERDPLGRYSRLWLTIPGNSGSLYVCKDSFGHSWVVEDTVTGESEWFEHLDAETIEDAESEAAAKLRAKLDEYAAYREALSELRAGRDPLDAHHPPARKAPTEGPP